MSSNSKNALRTVIMGAGNILMKDDGIGVHVVQAMQNNQGLPGGVELIDAGTAALDTFNLLDGVEKLIIIDAIKGGGMPGTIYKLTPDDIREKPRNTISLHQMSLLQALASNLLLGSAPSDITIIGVEPKEISMGTELSEEIAGRVEAIVEIAIEIAHDTCRKGRDNTNEV
ncbi:MAG: hydrogenase maturation protease [Candidatus Zixiibacteriota bacterium]